MAYDLPGLYSKEIGAPTDVSQTYPGAALPSTAGGAPEWASATGQDVKRMVGRYPVRPSFFQPPTSGTSQTAAPLPAEQPAAPVTASGTKGPGTIEVSGGGTSFTGSGDVSGGYSGGWTGGSRFGSVPIDPVKRDAEMKERGMVRDPYGNWMPPGGWGVSSGTGAGEQPVVRGAYRGLSGQRFYDETPISKSEEMPDLGSMTVPQLAAWGAKTRMARADKKLAAEQQGALNLESLRQAGETGRAGMRESREDARLRLTHELRREPTALELAQAEHVKGQTGVLTGQIAEQKEKSLLERAMMDKSLPDEARATAEKKYMMKFGSKEKSPEETIRLKAAYEQGLLDPLTGLPVVAKKANGGIIQGFARGGAITEPVTQTQQVHPAVAQYGQYLASAAASGVAPVPFNQYMNLLQSTRGAMQTTPSQFADGGDVSALGRPLEGPGTGRSDSIPATINGTQPAALSDGEFVIPAHVVKAKGTEFFEKLLAQYAGGAKENG